MFGYINTKNLYLIKIVRVTKEDFIRNDNFVLDSYYSYKHETLGWRFAHEDKYSSEYIDVFTKTNYKNFYKDSLCVNDICFIEKRFVPFDTLYVKKSSLIEVLKYGKDDNIETEYSRVRK